MSIKIAPFNDNSFPRINRRYQHYVSEHIWCLFILQERLASQCRSKYALVQQVGKKKWRWREGGGSTASFLWIGEWVKVTVTLGTNKTSAQVRLACSLYLCEHRKWKWPQGVYLQLLAWGERSHQNLVESQRPVKQLSAFPWSNGWQREGLSTCNLCRHTCVQSFKEPTLRSQMGTMPCVR